MSNTKHNTRGTQPGQPPRLCDDPYLTPYREKIAQRVKAVETTRIRLTQGRSLPEFASGHAYFGLHREGTKWVFREWAPHATAIHLLGEMNDWQLRPEYALRPLNAAGMWEIVLPPDAMTHGQLYRLHIAWASGGGDRIPAYARRVVQDDATKIFNAQVWCPEQDYAWRHEPPAPSDAPLTIYEAHVGMAQENPGIGTYNAFREDVLPRIADAGYQALQLMALMEHPYYGSFGYHVSSFFAASSRFGTPEELKQLIDEAHGMGLRVIMDIVHSHAVKNETEGLSCFDGTHYQYFHEGSRGEHPAWDSRCFDYGKPEVLHFLLSNCRFWLEEYHVDGFRFDGITSMLYHHRGLGPPFLSYDAYFSDAVDEDALVYLTLANSLVHTINPNAITIAEDVSGMPGLAAPASDQGCGFDYRLAMGVPDCWFKLANDVPDHDWNMTYLWHELTNKRAEEKTISYVECHDQSLVGGKTMLFELIDAAMYDAMAVGQDSLVVDRGLALHKMMRLATLATAGHGYLNFMGNEFGHPEWIDFPREGNNWSYQYARRQWHLRDASDLKFHFLADFDEQMLKLFADLHAPPPPELLCLHQDDHLLAFRRGDLFFLFNFHPEKSFTDYAIHLPAGTYRLVMDSDREAFGGHARLEPDQHYVTRTDPTGNAHAARFYLPSRTALVITPE